MQEFDPIYVPFPMKILPSPKIFVVDFKPTDLCILYLLNKYPLLT